MQQYLDLLNTVLINGKRHENRTGIATTRVTGAMLEFDLTEGFPALTTKKLAFGQVKGELLGFIHGYTSAADFRELGCSVWDQNANENAAWLANAARLGEDHLGRVYGAQWRRWWRWDGTDIDQLAWALGEIKNNPSSRRIVVTAWQPAELSKMALPPCHLLFQYHVDVESGELSMTMYQRSCDLFLGVPFNIASYALLLELTARATGLKAKRLVMFLADVHIYDNHIEQVTEQLSRKPFPLPTLSVDEHQVLKFHGSGIDYLEGLAPENIQLVNYQSHSPIKAPMAV